MAEITDENFIGIVNNFYGMNLRCRKIYIYTKVRSDIWKIRFFHPNHQTIKIWIELRNISSQDQPHKHMMKEFKVNHRDVENCGYCNLLL